MDINKLMNAKRVEVKYLDISKVDGEFVKNLRSKYNLTQVALANIIGVSKKAIEKWEQGKNRVNSSSAILMCLINENESILNQLYSVKIIDEKTYEDKFDNKKPIGEIYISNYQLNINKQKYKFNLPEYGQKAAIVMGEYNG